ncbi:MAG: hypothetical protein IT419_10760 [Planctomycetes bacterium]|nr:hypothetical protein [Planctomycetota bacterium]
MSDPLFRRRELPTAVEKKLPRAERRRLDEVLRAGDGASYREIYAQFKLGDRGVSYSSFYRYGARRRAVARIADLAGEDGAELACADGGMRTGRTEVRGSSVETPEGLLDGLDVEAIVSKRTEFDDIRLEHVAARYVCKYMIGLIHSGKASARQIERLANAYSKTASVQINRDRINAQIEHQRERIEIAHKSLQIRADALAARAQNAKPAGAKGNQHPDAPTADAPWGRKADGTPTTREEFLTRLDQACADIYGLDLKYGPKPIIKRFPGDHLPPEQRTPENIAAGQRGLLPHELEGERKAKEDRVRRAEFDAKRDAEEAASKAEEAARFAEEAQRRREEFERQVARGAAAARANKSVTSTDPAKHHPDTSPACHGGGTLNLVGEDAKESSADGGMRTARTEVRGSSGEADSTSAEPPRLPGTEAQRQAKLRADRRAEWEEEHKKKYPAPQKPDRPDTLDDLLKPKDRTCDLPNFCVDWKHK